MTDHAHSWCSAQDRNSTECPGFEPPDHAWHMLKRLGFLSGVISTCSGRSRLHNVPCVRNSKPCCYAVDMWHFERMWPGHKVRCSPPRIWLVDILSTLPTHIVCLFDVECFRREILDFINLEVKWLAGHRPADHRMADHGPSGDWSCAAHLFLDDDRCELLPGWSIVCRDDSMLKRVACLILDCFIRFGL